MVEGRIVYFPQPGPRNTELTFQAARRRAQELGIGTVVVASTRGRTGATAAEFFQGLRLIVVTHAQGYREPGTQELEDKFQAEIRARGGIVFTGTHAFGGIGRAVRRRFNTYQVDEIMANTLRLLGEGVKVAVEVALMATDAGLVSPQQDLIAIGGTGRGSDTALVLKPAHTQDFFNLRIKEIICKPNFGVGGEGPEAPAAGTGP